MLSKFASAILVSLAFVGVASAQQTSSPVFGPTFGGGGSGGGGSTASATLENVYASPGSFTFAHGLNSLFNQVHCVTRNGSTYAPATWTDFPVDSNDTTVTVPSAGDYICSFNASGTYSPPTQDFSIAVAPSSQTFWPTMTGTQTTPAYTVTQTAIGGYTGTANYTASGLASGMTPAYSPTSITGAGTSSLTLSFPATQAAATTAFTVQGADGTHTHTANPSITVGNINTGMVECWPMTDGSGTTFADGCGTGNTETITAGSFTWGTHTGLPGTTPFFNSGTYTTGANQTATNFTGTTPFSIAVWVAGCCSTPQSELISNFDNTAVKGWGFGTLNSGGNYKPYFVLYSSGTSGLYVNSSSVVSGSVLHYLVVTYDGSEASAGVNFYVDGTLQTNTVNNNTLSGNTSNSKFPTIGARTDGSELASGGAFAYLRVYNRVLSSSDVTNYYALGAR